MRTLCACIAVWAGAFIALAALRFESFAYKRFDLGNMAQAVWSTAHGHFLQTTEIAGGQISRLGVHVDPLLAAFAPLWWIWPSPLMLVSVQAVALALGAVPVFWLARKHLGSERSAVAAAAVYLLLPGLQFLALNEFHPTTFAVPLVLLAIWYLDEDRLVAFAIVATLAGLSQEVMPLVLGCLGLWYGVRHRRWGAGATIMLLGFAWTLIALKLVIPHYSGGESPYSSRYASVGGSPFGIVETAIRHPLRFASEIATRRDVGFVMRLTVPVLALFVLEPFLAAAALPGLALSLLSARATDVGLDSHLMGFDIPILIAAVVLGLGRLRRPLQPMMRRLLLAASLSTLLLGPLPFLLGGGLGVQPRSAETRAGADAIALVPPDVPVTATNHLASRLSARRQIFSFPQVRNAEWIVVDRRDPFLPVVTTNRGRHGYAVPVDDLRYQPARFRLVVAHLRHDPSWRVRFDRSGVLVFQRTRR